MYYLGVDVGGTNIATGIVDNEGKIIKKVSVETQGYKTSEEITKNIYSTIEAVIKETKLEKKDFGYIGVGIPGCVDNAEGKVILTENMNLTGFEFVKELKKYIDLPVYMANDANCAALGELIAGAAKGYSNALMITIGTGIGGGFVLNKKVYEGANGAALEAGHIIIEKNGKKCNCGRCGCFEQYASATALVELTKEYLKKYPQSLMYKYLNDRNEPTGFTSFKAAKQNDEGGLKVVEEFSHYLSEGIADLINLFQPEILIVVGGVSHEGDFLLDRVRNYIKEKVYAYGKIKSTLIKKAELGNDAGIIGAAFLEI